MEYLQQRIILSGGAGQSGTPKRNELLEKSQIDSLPLPSTTLTENNNGNNSTISIQTPSPATTRTPLQTPTTPLYNPTTPSVSTPISTVRNTINNSHNNAQIATPVSIPAGTSFSPIPPGVSPSFLLSSSPLLYLYSFFCIYILSVVIC